MSENVREKYAAALSAMIRKETVSEVGNEDRTKFREFHALLKKLFPHIFAAAEFEDMDGSFLLRWKGKDSSALPVLFMNHHDTVEANGDWSCDPFGGEIRDGKLWGRGTLDTKGGLWAMLQAADELAAEGFVPETDIYFESACNEETTNLGAAHIAEVLKERGITFRFVLDEGGMVLYEPFSGAKADFAMIGMAERGCSSLLFTATGEGGHASVPEENTPLVRLGKFMAEADKNRIFDVHVNHVIREMLRRMAPTVKGPLGFVYRHSDFFAPVLKLVMPKISPTARALVQTTIAFTMAEGSDGYNVIPAKATLVGNMRVSHHQGWESSLKAISDLAAKYDLETSVLEKAEDSRLADYNDPVFGLMEKAVKEAFPKAITAPYIMTGCSDARHMDPLTKNCLHFTPFYIDKKQMESIHGLDECVDLSTLEPAVTFYKYLMKEANHV